ncbi:serine hydrolase [Paenibacillus sp. DMB20]|uniref:serine hydrolase n=1 Tax=Paenibacillus sp. DMB20 TaxID=1642570 RepID=UPI00069AE997|nr:serine hydrolase [Paenibacillus sp. DMB20]
MIKRKLGKVLRALAVTGLGITLSVGSTVQAEADGTTPVKRPSAVTIDLGGLEKLLDRFMKERIGADKMAPGAAVTVVQNGRIMLSKGYGYADLKRKKPVDPDRTLFRIGSVTKTFTAAAIMQLAEQGKLDLHGDIQEYLGGIRLDNPFPRPVTIHDLLTHTSGFQVTVETKEDMSEDLSTFVSLKEYIVKNKPPVVREPGTSYMYDNYAFNLLGLIIENVTGMPYRQYMEENVLKPLQMDNSQMMMTKQALPNLATGYDDSNSPIPPYMLAPTAAPDGGMLTTAENAAHFMIAQLNGGTYEDSRLWNGESLRLMQKFHSSIVPEYPDTTYGYENMLEPGKNNGQWIIGKGGDVPGYSSFMLMLPEHNIGIFMTFNKPVSSVYVAREWNDMFMEKYFPAPPTDAAAAADVAYPVSSQRQLKRFEGIYSDLRIKIMLTRVMATGKGELTVVDDFTGAHKLKQKGELVFEDENGGTLAFKSDKDGNIAYLKYGNPVGYAGKSAFAFRDVSADSEYAPFINNLQAMGIIQGGSDRSYLPKHPLTRAQLSAMLVRMMGSSLTQEPSQFKDTEGTWAEREVEAAVASGFMKGIGERRFDPDRALTRQEAAAILVPVFRAAAPESFAQLKPSKVKLADKPASEVAESVKLLVAAGITGPDAALKPDGAIAFRGTEQLTRQEAAVWFTHFVRKMVLGVE